VRANVDTRFLLLFAVVVYCRLMSRHGIQELAGELSRSWHDLGRVLASRRLLASLHPGTPTLTPTKLRALDVIGDADGVRVGELADRIGIDETTATRLVDRLEAAGLAERRSATDDRRVTLVGLTEPGLALVKEVARRRQRFFCDVLAALEPDERAELVRLTRKAAGALRDRSEALTAR
jgi:DNA-binding MarR family transcriptional regulator